MLSPDFLHFLAAGIPIVLSGIGSGIGQGIAGFGALHAMARQQQGTNHIFRAMILGLALIETGAILSLVITLMLLFGGPFYKTVGVGLSELGMGLAIGLASAAISIASSFAVKAACQSIARQPFFATKISTIMLLSQSIIEAPAVFAFIVTLLIKAHITNLMTTAEGIKFLSAGIAIGIGAIGPSIGQAIFAHSSCRAVGLNKDAFNKIFTFSLLSQAVIETPIIFCLLVAITIIYKPIDATGSLWKMASFFVPAFTVSVGSLGTAVATGYAASKSSNAIATNSEHYPLFIRTSLLAQAIIESSAIYALIVSLILMTKKL